MHLQIIYSLLVVGGLFTFVKAQNMSSPSQFPPLPKSCRVPVLDTRIEILKSANTTGSYPRSAVSGQLGQPGPKGPTGVSLHFVDTCPAVTRYYTIPKAVTHLGKVCWVLKPWSQHRIRYATCSIPTCRNVFGRVVPGVLGSFCRRSNWRSYLYYVICPNPWRIYPKFVNLPQCCSCYTLKCG